MNLGRTRPRLQISNGPRKKDVVEKTIHNLGGTLSPDLQPSQPVFTKPEQYNVLKIGKYLLLDRIEGETFRAVHYQTREESVCKIIELNHYREILSAYWQVDSHENISSISELILGETKAYVFFEQHYGDLHSYVRQKKRLKEEEASRLFRQIVSAVQHCHENGVVLRDLKLRKFVFKNADKTELRLDGLEDAFVLPDDSNDQLTDKHGCPAYVSPEILNSNAGYSGKAADIWSLGVMLYTMLVGRYPFHDADPSALFGKIRRGQFSIPPMLSTKAKCVIKSMLRQDPMDRLPADQILCHPWLQGSSAKCFVTFITNRYQDQAVPDIVNHDSEEEIFL